MSAALEQSLQRLKSALQDTLSHCSTASVDVLNNGDAEDGKTVVRSQVLDLARQLDQRLQTPLEAILGFASSAYDLATLHVYHHFDLAAHVPLPPNAPASARQIAADSKLGEDDVRRILRYLTTCHVVCEPSPDAFEAAPLGCALATDRACRALAGLMLDEQFPAAAKLARCWETPRALATSDPPAPRDTAWALANGRPARPMMEELGAAHPRRAAQLTDTMALVWAHMQPLAALVDNGPWAALPPGALVVDAGGGMGTAAVALARAFPALRLLVTDLPGTVERGAAGVPRDVADRVAFAAHDLLAERLPPPATGAAAVLLRSVLHAWPDEDAVRILRGVVNGLPPGARVVVCEGAPPVPGEVDARAERAVRAVDLSMACLFDTREREQDEWARLFERADPRLRFDGVRRPSVNRTKVPTHQLLCFIEGTIV